jgi:hypothetical protein
VNDIVRVVRDEAVVAVAAPAHAAGDVASPEHRLVVFAGVRAALIGVVQQPGPGAPVLQRHLQNPNGKVPAVDRAQDVCRRWRVGGDRVLELRQSIDGAPRRIDTDGVRSGIGTQMIHLFLEDLQHATEVTAAGIPPPVVA